MRQRRQWHPTPVLLPGKSHGQRSLVDCSPWVRYKSDTTEWLHFHFSLSCIGGGNGNPLQNFCLENPRDGGAWWAAVYGVAQSRTQLKRLSSSSRIWEVREVKGNSQIPVSQGGSFFPILGFVLHLPSCQWNKNRPHISKCLLFIPELLLHWSMMFVLSLELECLY